MKKKVFFLKINCNCDNLPRGFKTVEALNFITIYFLIIRFILIKKNIRENF
jgi:hypothetical protein